MPIYIILMFLVISSSGFATLEKGAISLRSEYNFSSADELWLVDDSSFGTPRRTKFAKGAGRNYFQFFNFLSSYGVTDHLQINAKASYAHSEFNASNQVSSNPSTHTEANVSDGDKINDWSEFKLGISYLIYHLDNFGLTGSLHYSIPGTRQNRNSFIAISDGRDKLELELNPAIYFENFALDFFVNYIKKFGVRGDQANLAMAVPIFVFDDIIFGPSLDYTHTFDGLGVNDGPTFNNRFSQKKERFIGARAFLKVYFTQKTSFETYLHRKLTGQNTDVATSIGFALEHLL